MIRIRNILLALLLFACQQALHAQDYFCVSVDSLSGEVLVTCHPADYTKVTYYEITYSDLSGIYSGSFNVFPTGPEDTYPISGTNGAVTIFNIDVIFHPASVSPYGFSLSSVKLNVTPVSGGIARLDWNPVHTSLQGTYYIERYEDPVWNQLDAIKYTTPSASLLYLDTITYPFCDASTVYYRVRFDENPSITGCTSVSSIASGTFQDLTQPIKPQYDTVSIYQDPTGTYTSSIILGWTESITEDVVGYEIYRAVTASGQFDPIGLVPDGTFQYIDVFANPCIDGQEYYYAIVATDGCDNGSANIYHSISPHNIVLTASDIDPCQRKINLSWNDYANMPGGLGGYILYRQINNDSFMVVDTLDGSVLEYSDSLLFINGNSYTYYVRAFSSGGLGSSSSCLTRKVYNGPVVPDSLYIEQVSVINDQFNEIKYYYTPANRIRQLLLERSDNPSGPFATVETLSASGTNFLPQEFSIIDSSAQVHQQSYWYRLTMIDSCNNAALSSVNTSTSIYLSCSTQGDNSNVLSWNPYATWNNGVEQYELYRLINGSPDPATPLTVLSSPPFEYTDAFSSQSALSQTCYYVIATESPGNPVIANAFSMSNLACAIRDAVIYLPNAFNPESQNNRFRPVHSYIEPGSFSMQIYSKWGLMVFETDDIYSGWNGQINGSPAPVDVYLYRITFKSYEGETLEKKGLVTLVR